MITEKKRKEQSIDGQTNKRTRDSRFELLRIIAMLCIVTGHSMTHGVLTGSEVNTIPPVSFILCRFLAYGGKTGVYLFVLITGYFMIDSNISVKKLVKLWLPILFWSAVITVTGGILLDQLSANEIALSVIPILSNRYWFMSTYVFLYLLSPVINIALSHTSRNQDVLIILLTLLTIAPCDYLYGADVNSWLVSFCFTYAIGAIIKKYHILQKKNFIKYGCILLASGIAFNTGSSIFIGLNARTDVIASALEKETLFDLFIAIGIFILVGSGTQFYNRKINAIASTTFGIYLIHDNPKMETLLWIRGLHFDRLAYKGIYSMLYILLVDFIVFAICAVLEFIRKKALGKTEEVIAEKTGSIAFHYVRHLDT